MCVPNREANVFMNRKLRIMFQCLKNSDKDRNV